VWVLAAPVTAPQHCLQYLQPSGVWLDWSECTGLELMAVKRDLTSETSRIIDIL
jgi:hypothetical protein